MTVTPEWYDRRPGETGAAYLERVRFLQLYAGAAARRRRRLRRRAAVAVALWTLLLAGIGYAVHGWPAAGGVPVGLAVASRIIRRRWPQ